MGEREDTLDGQDVIDRRAHCGDTSRQTVGALGDSNGREQDMVQGFVCSGVLHAIGTAQCVTRSAGTSTSVLDARSHAEVWTHGWVRGLRWEGGLYTHECRAGLEHCLAKDLEAPARPGAKVSDPGVLKESTSPRKMSEDAPPMAQLAQARAGHGTSFTHEPRGTDSGGEAWDCPSER